jgi:hypothetical protein
MPSDASCMLEYFLQSSAMKLQRLMGECETWQITENRQPSEEFLCINEGLEQYNMLQYNFDKCKRRGQQELITI